MALAEKLKKNETLTVIFMGDGALGEGVVYEALNMASLWSAPILFVIENNHIAQTTPIELNLSGSITERFSAFGITTKSMNSNDVVKINSITQEILNSIRQNSKPQAYVIDTHRFAPHSKGDDTRDKNYIETLKNSHDPIPILAAQIDSEIRDRIELEVSEQVDVAFQTALDDPLLVVD
jgi:TPP-dependent pyruvate/acetoin dehydrogenase alpha subunit